MKFALGSTTSTPGPSTSRHHLPGLVEEYLSRRDQRRRPHTPTRYCSACLAEDGTWRTTWTSPLHRVCVTHGTYLVDTCHECDQRLFTGTAWAGRDRDPWTCTQHTGRTDGTGRHRRPCAADLRTAQPAPGTSTHLTTQRRLLQLGDNVLDEAPITVCGIATTHLEHAVAVLDLIHEQLPGGLRGDCDPAFLLDAADHALTVLDQPDPATAMDTARRLGLGTFQRLFRPTTTTPPKHSASPLLETIVIASVADHLSPTAQLTYRTHSATPRYPSSEPRGMPWSHQSRPGEVQLAWVPTVLWTGVLGQWISDDDLEARAVASLLLAKVGSRRSWQFIALDLGLPAAFAHRPPAQIRQLKHNGQWDDFHHALDDLATRLEDAPPPIDYQARRWLVRDLDAFQSAYATASEALSMTQSDQARLAPAIYVASHRTLAPHPYAHHDGAPEPRPGDDDLINAVLPLLDAALTSAVGEPKTGPTTWQPP